jgi:hypothetical protein
VKGERLPQRILPNARTFHCKRCAASSGVSKRISLILGPQQDPVLVAEEVFQLTCGLGLLKINSSLQFLNEVWSELVEDILLAIRRKMWYLYGAPAPSPYVQNAQIRKNRHSESSWSLFTLLFKPLCFLNKLQALFYHHFTNQT